MARKEENAFDFLGLFTEEIGGKKNKSNGAIKFHKDKLLIEKRSRLNGKLKDSYEIRYDELDSESIDRPAINRVEIKLKDKTISLKTLDHDMLDNFEDKLLNIIEGPKIAVEDSAVAAVPSNAAGLNADSAVASAPSAAELKTDSKIGEIDIPDQIRKYHELYKEGIISEEEFENKKKELLDL